MKIARVPAPKADLMSDWCSDIAQDVSHEPGGQPGQPRDLGGRYCTGDVEPSKFARQRRRLDDGTTMQDEYGGGPIDDYESTFRDSDW